jgi:hypothetical protein
MHLLILIAAFLIRKAKYNELFWVLSWPGTLVHELCHYVVGFVLFARPTKLSLLPEHRDDTGQTMGYVDFANIQWYNALPTGLAPLLGIFVALFLAGNITNDFTIGNVFWGWVTASVLSQVLPSSQDWRVAFSSPTGAVAYATLAGMLML